MHTTDTSTTPVRGRPYIQDLSWVLEPLMELPGVTHGVILSRDGLALGGSATLPREVREAVAAVTATILGGSRALAGTLPIRGPQSGEEPADIDDVVISARGGFFFLAPAAQRAALIVTATPRVDVGQIAYHVRLQTTRLARALEQASSPRTPGLPA